MCVHIIGKKKKKRNPRKKKERRKRKAQVEGGINRSRHRPKAKRSAQISLASRLKELKSKCANNLKSTDIIQLIEMQKHRPDLCLLASIIKHTKSPPINKQDPLLLGEGQNQTLSEVHVPRQRYDGVRLAIIMNLYIFSISPGSTKFTGGPRSCDGNLMQFQLSGG